MTDETVKQNFILNKTLLVVSASCLFFPITSCVLIDTVTIKPFPSIKTHLQSSIPSSFSKSAFLKLFSEAEYATAILAVFSLMYYYFTVPFEYQQQEVYRELLHEIHTCATGSPITAIT